MFYEKEFSKMANMKALRGFHTFPLEPSSLLTGLTLRDKISAGKGGNYEEKNLFMGVFGDLCAAFVIYPVDLGRRFSVPFDLGFKEKARCEGKVFTYELGERHRV